VVWRVDHETFTELGVGKMCGSCSFTILTYCPTIPARKMHLAEAWQMSFARCPV
jgi:hypothetical protein